MEPAKTLSIQIVTWNSARYLPDLFESLDRQKSQDFTVTVVDNGSTDGTLEWLRLRQPGLILLRNFRNQGFARAHNQALALARTRWLEQGADLQFRYAFLLNPDCILHPNCVAELCYAMQAQPKVALAGPKLLRAVRQSEEEGERALVTLTNSIDSTGLVIKKSRQAEDRGAGEEDRGQYDQSEPFGISGAALVVRASTLTELQPANELFDEDFFAYKEDVDLAWRLRLLGREVAFLPRAIVWHYRRAKPTQRPGLLARWWNNRQREPSLKILSHRNQRWLEWKNDDWVNRFIHLPWLLPETLARFCAVVLDRHAFRAMLLAWLGRSQIQAKRRELMRRRQTSPANMRRWLV